MATPRKPPADPTRKYRAREVIRQAKKPVEPTDDADAPSQDPAAERLMVRPWLRIAAAWLWDNPTVIRNGKPAPTTHADIAKVVGKARETVSLAMHTKEWDVAFREAGKQHIARLAPSAVSALVRAWGKGNASGALEVLRSFGLLQNERREITGPGGGPVGLDVDATNAADRLARALDKLAARGPGGSPEGADPG